MTPKSTNTVIELWIKIVVISMITGVVIKILSDLPIATNIAIMVSLFIGSIYAALLMIMIHYYNQAEVLSEMHNTQRE